MALSPIIKELVIQALNAAQLTDITFGKVTKVNPLEVYVDNDLTLHEQYGHLKLTRAVTDYETELTMQFGERQKVTIHNALKVGDSVILVRKQGGQSYIVLDKVGKSTEA